MKKNWILILIVFLLVSNAALVSTLIISNRTANTENFKNSGNYPGRYSRTPQGFEHRLSDELGLSESQASKLKEFRNNHHELKHKYITQIQELKKQYFQGLTSELNEAKLTQLADSLGKTHAKIILLDHQHYKNIRSICTPEQSRILDSLGNMHINNRYLEKNRGRHGRRHHKSASDINNKSECNESKKRYE